MTCENKNKLLEEGSWLSGSGLYKRFLRQIKKKKVEDHISMKGCHGQARIYH